MSNEALLSQKRFRVQQAFKVSLACVISIFIANWLDMPLAFFAPIGSFVIMTVFHDQTIEKGLERVAGPLIATLLVTLLLNISQSLLFYLIVVLLVLIVGTYFFFRERFAYAALMGAIIGGACVTLAINDPSQGIMLGFHFVEVTIVGVLVAWFVTMFIWPVKRDRDLYPNLLAVIDDLAKMVKGKQRVTVLHFSYLRQLLDYSRYQLTNQRSYNNHYHFIIALKQLYLRIESYLKVKDQLKTKAIYQAFSNHIEPLITLHDEALERHLTTVKEACSTKQSVNLDLSELEQKITELERSLSQWREEGRFADYEIEDILELFAFLSVMRGLQIHLRRLQERLAHLVAKEVSESVKREEKEKEALLPLDDAALKKSIKLSLAVFIMLFLHVFYGFYSSLQSIITVTVILAQPNYGRAEHRGELRFLGVFVGGVLGFIGLLLLSFMTHFYVLLIYFFVWVFVLDMIALSGERWGYAGLQAVVMLPLILLVSNGPVTTMTIAWQRFVGVIIGVIIATIIALVLWPNDPVKQLKKKLSSSLAQCRHLFQLAVRPDKQESVLVKHEVEAALSAHEALVYDASQVLGEEDQGSLFVELVNVINEIYSATDYIDRLRHSDERNQLTKAIWSEFEGLFGNIDKAMLGLSKVLAGETLIPVAVDSLLVELTEKIRGIRESKVSANYETEALENYAMTMVSLQRLLQALARVDKVIRSMNHEQPITLSGKKSYEAA